MTTSVAHVRKRLEIGNPFSMHYTDCLWLCGEIARLEEALRVASEQAAAMREELDAEPMSDEAFR